MNATLSFDLNEPEDKDKFEIHCKAEKMHIAIEHFSEFLRRNWKHKELSEIQHEILEEIQTQFAETFFGD
jgi:hypothetical protein